jgi:hypothetical protein
MMAMVRISKAQAVGLAVCVVLGLLPAYGGSPREPLTPIAIAALAAFAAGLIAGLRGFVVVLLMGELAASLISHAPTVQGPGAAGPAFGAFAAIVFYWGCAVVCTVIGAAIRAAWRRSRGLPGLVPLTPVEAIVAWVVIAAAVGAVPAVAFGAGRLLVIVILAVVALGVWLETRFGRRDESADGST